MKQYLIKVKAYCPAPREREYRVMASGFHVAISRAVKNYRKDIGRKKIREMIIKGWLLGSENI